MYLSKKIASGAERSFLDFQRSQENLLDQTGAYNQRGLEYALENLVYGGSSNCGVLKVSVRDLGKYNDILLNHPLTDNLLANIFQQVNQKLSEVFQEELVGIYRNAADWVVLFKGEVDADIFAEKLSKARNIIVAITQAHVAGAQDHNMTNFPNDIVKNIELAVTALDIELGDSSLQTVYYDIIDHLRPARGLSAEKETIIKNADIIQYGDVMKVTNIKQGLNTLYNSPEFLAKQTEYIYMLEQGTDFAAVKNEIITEAKNILQARDENVLDVNFISCIDYNKTYRGLGRRIAFVDSSTIIVPLVNSYGKSVFGIKIKLKNENKDWNKEITIDGHSNVIDHVNTDYGQAFRVGAYYSSLFQNEQIQESFNLLISLRKYFPILSLLDQTGRSPFFGRAIEYYLSHILNIQNSIDVSEDNPDNLIKKIESVILTREDAYPEHRLITRLLEEDGFVFIKRGGEEFFVYFVDDDGTGIGLAFDYNKFSRFGISWGEGAGDLYMERTAGLLRYHLVNEIKKLGERNKSTIRDAFEAAINSVNQEVIKYKVTDLDTVIINKGGKKIIVTSNQAGEQIFFAASDQQELQTLVYQYEQQTGLMINPVDFDNKEIYLTRRNLLAINGKAIGAKEKSTVIDLNSIKSINPKGVYFFSDENGINIFKGSSDQQLLTGLSLAGSIINAGDRSLEELIAISEHVAERAKDNVNGLAVDYCFQCSRVFYETDELGG